ncbi:DGQHR domain-containing protein DpdB [Stagnihabitans tardus]|uniref:DGQHR domain-containing protein n=1 Tax=Stagnihabitans tardus TaxID=2699202 RepID=A0AAE5BXR9_9RHOB|nr:DGQHR domain-containing protein DpdB [Stagnihabitans tardus]NBZ89643.1 DGQHR domain-containing protein [Stagnihabitans tardus]
MRSLKTFAAIYAKQSAAHDVLTFTASASDILDFAVIDRAGREADGSLNGFQRPQIAGHIRNIRDYLEQEDAVLPNPIVVAFLGGLTVVDRRDDGHCRVEIDTSTSKPGVVVDGQQRLTALSQTSRGDFQLFVSAVVCRDEAELKRQFVLINSARPLPKSLIYELLPAMQGLSRKMGERAVAAELTARLNFTHGSALQGLIHQHTNPDGVVKDTAIQKVIMNSASDGIMREFLQEADGLDRCYGLINEYFWAIRDTFPGDWEGHKPKTSRLVHGAGIVAMGHVMELIAYFEKATTRDQFAIGLACLKPKTAWTQGEWDFGNGERRSWRGIQNVSSDIALLSDYLVREVRIDQRDRLWEAHKASEQTPAAEGSEQ